MDTTPSAPYKSDFQQYHQLNFHPIELIESIEAWLSEKPLVPLFLGGETGSGRCYVLMFGPYR